jgi:hypothetical protein
MVKCFFSLSSYLTVNTACRHYKKKFLRQEPVLHKNKPVIVVSLTSRVWLTHSLIPRALYKVDSESEQAGWLTDRNWGRAAGPCSCSDVGTFWFHSKGRQRDSVQPCLLVRRFRCVLPEVGFSYSSGSVVMMVVRFSAGPGLFFFPLSQNSQTGSGVHSASYSRVKRRVAWSWR